MSEQTSAKNLPDEAAEPAAEAGPAPAPAAEPVARPEAKAARGSRAVPVLAIALVLAFAGIGWLALHGQQSGERLRRDFATRLGELDAIAREGRAEARSSQNAIADLQQRLARAEAALAEAKGQQAAIEALYQSVARSREDQVLVEVEQSVGFAVQQLQLAGDIGAALAAMRSAEARLGKGDAAPLVGLRKALIRDIERLASAAQLDVPGTAMRLEVLTSAVEHLPLAFMAPLPESKVEKAPPEAGGALARAKQMAGDVWAEVRSMVRVERLDRPDPALISPAQEIFLRENIRLRLLSARLALLARDGGSYLADLKAAREWLERYFDAKNERVANSIEELQRLAALKLENEDIPSIDATVAALRTLQQRAPVLAPAASARPDGAPAAAARD